VSVEQEYSIRRRPRSGLVPRNRPAMKNPAPAGNILSRLRPAGRQTAALRLRGDGVFAGKYRVIFSMTLPLSLPR
jgi:hypothetical protein